MTIRRLVLNVRRRYRYATRTLLRRIVNLVVCLELATMLLRHHLRNRRCQRRLPMIHVTNGPYVYMRLATVKFFLGHG
jgi:hypothetical protein